VVTYCDIVILILNDGVTELVLLIVIDNVGGVVDVTDVDILLVIE
jgi:hypothetical protein